MARISFSDLHLGEGPSEKYSGILNAVMQEVLTIGVPEGCDEKRGSSCRPESRPCARQCKRQSKATQYRN